jgi:hypothetical protein
MQIKVECYSGYRGEETPRALQIGDKKIEVKKILDRWLAPDHRYFKFIGDDGATYIIRHDHQALRWELILLSNKEIQDMSDIAGKKPKGAGKQF